MRHGTCLQYYLLVFAWLCSIPAAGQSTAETIEARSSLHAGPIVSDTKSACWLLVRSDLHTPEPARWVAMSARDCRFRTARIDTAAPASQIVIRPGENVDLDEHSAVAEVHLRVKSLNYARSGEAIGVRLSPTGHVLRAIAVGPGRAVLSKDGGPR